MVNYISGLVFVVLGLVGLLVSGAAFAVSPLLGAVVLMLWFLGDLILSSAIRLAALTASRASIAARRIGNRVKPHSAAPPYERKPHALPTLDELR